MEVVEPGTQRGDVVRERGLRRDLGHAGQDSKSRAMLLAVDPGGIWCVSTMAGAYQPSHVYVLFDERGAVPVKTVLRFSVYHSGDGRSLGASMETELWGESVVSPQSRELSVLTLSRQLADCGIWSRYRIGTDPTLIAAAARLPCPAAPGSPAESTDAGPPRGWRPIRLRR